MVQLFILLLAFISKPAASQVQQNLAYNVGIAPNVSVVRIVKTKKSKYHFTIYIGIRDMVPAIRQPKSDGIREKVRKN
jgi:hypothetical protein